MIFEKLDQLIDMLESQVEDGEKGDDDEPAEPEAVET
jgi:hypothetical protein